MLEFHWSGDLSWLNLSDFLFSYFVKEQKHVSQHWLYFFFCFCSMFVTNWWKFMESRVKQVMSSTLTPAQRTSSVDISSSISEVQFSKITCMQVRSTLAQDNFFFLPGVIQGPEIILSLLSRPFYSCDSSASPEQTQRRNVSQWRRRQQWHTVCLSRPVL